MKKLICIVCPKGCEITITKNGVISGNSCLRGEIYAKEETTCPRRMLTSSIRVSNREDVLCPIKTSQSVKKEDLFKFMDFINRLTVEAPINLGEVVARDVFGTGIDIITTKNIK